MMQAPPHRSLLEHHFRKTPCEVAKYVRTEYRDCNPSWLLAEHSANSRVRMGIDSRKPVLIGSIAPEIPSHVLVRDRPGADR